MCDDRPTYVQEIQPGSESPITWLTVVMGSRLVVVPGFSGLEEQGGAQGAGNCLSLVVRDLVGCPGSAVVVADAPNILRLVDVRMPGG